ncbi:hypothetical protein OG21DRAFT_797322 [Imleria badia]|nr:hypothetical protein OG21DRAFT_797322 [Imleria badia]
MSIIKTEGIIEVSATVPEPVSSVGDGDADKDFVHIPFNDLEIVGGLPSSLNVVGISDIVVYNVQDDTHPEDHDSKYVVGIETVYKLDSGKLSPPVLHGTKTIHLTRIRVKSR